MQDRLSAIEIARGKWPALLGKWLDERALQGKHTKCPTCEGKDRFRFDNKEGTGSWICSHCGAGYGLCLLQNINGWSFREAAEFVESNAGKFKAQPIKPARSEADLLEDLRKVWNAAKRIEEGDPVHTYLTRRCRITEVPKGLRYHPSLPYHDDGEVTYHPAMVAQVLWTDGTPVSIHRTYLTSDGRKADVPTPKKLMPSIRKLEGVAVRLASPVEGWLGVAEGIETALCASLRFKIPVWSCICAGMLESFKPPEGIKFVQIYADNDKSYTGQASAYKLARALTNIGIECNVSVPEIPGADYADDVIGYY